MLPAPLAALLLVPALGFLVKITLAVQDRIQELTSKGN
jgi:hypothetical protein